MLASPEPTAESIWARHEELHAAAEIGAPEAQATPLAAREAARTPAAHPGVVWVEDKFDGVRAQLHRAEDGRVEIYSRDLRRVTGQFEEIAKAVSGGMKDCVIFDGEIVAYEKGKRLTFFDLQKRLGRRGPDLFMKEHVPIVLLVFDLLHLNGRSLLAEPLSERRRLLETLPIPVRPCAGWTWSRRTPPTRSRPPSTPRAATATRASSSRTPRASTRPAGAVWRGSSSRRSWPRSTWSSSGRNGATASATAS